MIQVFKKFSYAKYSVRICSLIELYQVEEANEVHSDWLKKCVELAEFKKTFADLGDSLDLIKTEIESCNDKGEDVGSVEALIASHRVLT